MSPSSDFILQYGMPVLAYSPDVLTPLAVPYNSHQEKKEDSFVETGKSILGHMALGVAGSVVGGGLGSFLGPAGTVLGSSLGSALGEGLSQCWLDGKDFDDINWGPVASAFTVSGLMGGAGAIARFGGEGLLATNALVKGAQWLNQPSKSGFASRVGASWLTGVVSRASSVLADDEDDSFVTAFKQVFNPLALVMDALLGEVGRKFIGGMGAESHKLYRDRLLGHGVESRVVREALPEKQVSTEKAVGHFIKRTALVHAPRRLFWALHGDSRGGHVGSAQTALGISQRFNMSLIPDEGMQQKMADFAAQAKREGRPVMFAITDHESDVDIPVDSVFAGLGDDIYRMSMGSKDDQPWFYRPVVWIYSAFGINRANREKALQAIVNSGSEGLRLGGVGPGLYVAGSRGVGIGAAKDGFAHAALAGIDGKVPLIGILTHTGTGTIDMRVPRAHLIYGDFDFVDPLKLCGLSARPEARSSEFSAAVETLTGHVRQTAYDAQARHLRRMSLEAPEQFGWSLARFYPVLAAYEDEALDARVKSAVLAAHVTDPLYVERVIKPLVDEKGVRQTMWAAVKDTSFSLRMVQKNIDKLKKRIERYAQELQEASSEEEAKSLREKSSYMRRELGVMEESVLPYLQDLKRAALAGA